MRKIWSSLTLGLASLLACVPSSHAQAVHTADRNTRIQAGLGVMYLSPDYGDHNIAGFSGWADYDFSKWVGVEIGAHLGEFSTPDDITENTYFVGPRLTYHHRKFTGYGKLMVGRGTITNTLFNLSSSYNFYSYGGGVEYKVNRRINIRAVDVDVQKWGDFEPHTLSPMAITVGVSYIIH